MGEITQILVSAQAGDRQALDKLFHALYPELKRLAHTRLLRNARDTLLNTTAVVHDCYLKMLQTERLSAPDRARFFGYAATVMRSIIVDAVRARHRQGGGGGATQLPLATDLVDRLPQNEDEILDVEAALVELARLDPRQSCSAGLAPVAWAVSGWPSAPTARSSDRWR